MYKMFIEIGFALSSITNAILFIPQLLAIYKKHSAQGLSVLTFLGFNIIQLFTLLHGFVDEDPLLMIGSGLSLMTCGAVTALVSYYRFKKV